MNVAFHEIEAPRAAGAYRDPRADGGHRDVTLTVRQVTIGRRLRGVQMKIKIPVNAYEGVTLGLEKTLIGRLCYKVALRHRDHDLGVLLLETFDECEATAMWRGWAEHLSLAMLVEREDGALELFAGAHSRMVFGRRRGARATTRSRGRFAQRRRMGHARNGGASCKGEREIICYE
ncbi:MAG: DUF6101 family protein [Beijerinckiaceae bacterium]